MDSTPFRLFLLSPAHCGGKRAQLLINGRGRFPLAARLRAGESVTLGETFAFLSGLYFRGKLTYARHFGRAPSGHTAVMVITANNGLVPAESSVTIRQLKEFGTVDIDSDNPRYRKPLQRDIARLRELDGVEIVLLGSIATGKYVDVLLESLGDRLLFPGDFVGRGDMSRGALLLQAARKGTELRYEPVLGAIRTGRRAPRIATG
jgi:hypothetical protein